MYCRWAPGWPAKDLEHGGLHLPGPSAGTTMTWKISLLENISEKNVKIFQYSVSLRNAKPRETSQKHDERIERQVRKCSNCQAKQTPEKDPWSTSLQTCPRRTHPGNNSNFRMEFTYADGGDLWSVESWWKWTMNLAWRLPEVVFVGLLGSLSTIKKKVNAPKALPPGWWGNGLWYFLILMLLIFIVLYCLSPTLLTIALFTTGSWQESGPTYTGGFFSIQSCQSLSWARSDSVFSSKLSRNHF